MKSSALVPFTTWQEVLEHVRSGYTLFYQAPLDLHAIYAPVVKVFKNGKIRIKPLANDVDPFTADRGHLARCRKAVSIE